MKHVSTTFLEKVIEGEKFVARNYTVSEPVPLTINLNPGILQINGKALSRWFNRHLVYMKHMSMMFLMEVFQGINYEW